MKISVHITFYIKNKNKLNLQKLNKVIKSYLTLSNKTYIYIHCNFEIKKKIKFVTFIKHNLKNKDPHKLSWMCRPYMKKQKDYFDYFIYSEDDIIFNKKNFKAWLKFKDVCIRKKFNLSFLRTETLKKNNELWSIDQPTNINQSLIINKRLFVILKNPYCAMWIYDKKEFKNFIKSKYWNLNNWLGNNPYTDLKTREKSAIGWNGLNMNRYKASIVPIQNYKVLNDFYIKHLGEKYLKYGPFSINTSKLINRDLVDYKDDQKNSFKIFLLNMKFFYKKYLRINLKKYKSN